MELQLCLDLTTDDERRKALEAFLRPLQLADRQFAALCLLGVAGTRETISGQSVSKLSISKYDAGKRANMAPNTFLEGIRDLEAIGVVAVVKNARPWTFFVNWHRVAKLVPPDTETVPVPDLFSETWSAPVSLGQGVRDSVSVVLLKSVYRDSVSVIRDTEALTQLDQPWNRDTGFQDRDLVRCVLEQDILPLRFLYDEAVKLGWIKDCDHARHKFLTLCHHCATCNGLHSRMGVLVARVKGNLDVQKVRNASGDWAESIFRQATRDPQLARSRITRELKRMELDSTS